VVPGDGGGTGVVAGADSVDPGFADPDFVLGPGAAVDGPADVLLMPPLGWGTVAPAVGVVPAVGWSLLEQAAPATSSSATAAVAVRRLLVVVPTMVLSRLR
jgi:hypothetical protein